MVTVEYINWDTSVKIQSDGTQTPIPADSITNDPEI